MACQSTQKIPVKGGKRYTRAGMLRRYTNSFSDYSTRLDLDATSLKERLSPFSCSKTNISPASSFANPDARTVEHCIARYTFDSFLHQLSSLLDQQHVLGTFFIWVIILPSGMAWRLLEGNKLDARNGLFTQISPSHTFFLKLLKVDL
jgi:hypothetical protein